MELKTLLALLFAISLVFQGLLLVRFKQWKGKTRVLLASGALLFLLLTIGFSLFYPA
ncbi:hypothetical protein V8J88_17745 [Massilia sp. W12]|uniref:hypothetical protein n=1 Tax=Massilia sp. W12 TaxID=3126507 RepID=UPI0030D2EEFC